MGLALQRGDSSRLFSSPGSFPDAQAPVERRPAPNMASADSCPIILDVATQDAAKTATAYGQASPDKNVIFRYATAAFTVSPKPRALSCCADLPRDSALYAVSVRRLTVLHSGFLQTVPHGPALAFG